MRKINQLNENSRQSSGFTLLEYAAGAAVIGGIVLLCMQTLGTGFTDFFGQLSGWVSNLQGPLNNPQGTP